MASIGRFSLAAASGTQETTLALANLNFVFSLVKMEADVEYRGVGTALSKRRKREAEDGRAHATARQLGALFADELPSIPNLRRAYGLRVSEIMGNPKFNPRGSIVDGLFRDQAGADGTSIWAAATSGRGAIEVHLLACLLARMWKAHEAISIWSEIVMLRKCVLQKRVNEDQLINVNLITASQIDVGREKLAEWDASARAWLQIADSAKRNQQKQLELIVDNMSLQPPPKASVYEEVVNVWTNSMIMVDKVISGVPQSVQRGDGLLGLCAWHIYPDICAEGLRTTRVDQKDDLVSRGGIVTLGLSDSRGEHPSGFRWSMPLAHKRYYGKAVTSCGLVGSNNSLIDLIRIVQIAIGSLSSTWPSRDAELDKVAQFLVEFSKATESVEESHRWDKFWPSLLCRESQAYIKSTGEDRKITARYVDRGRRLHKDFLGTDGHDIFGLADPTLYINLLQSEDRVSALRDLAQLHPSPEELNEAIILTISSSYTPETECTDDVMEYATVFPQPIAGTQRKIHRRWVLLPSSESTSPDIDAANFRRRRDSAIQRSIEIMLRFKEPCGLLDAAILRNGPIDSRPYDDGRVHKCPRGFAWNAGEVPPSLEHLQSYCTKQDMPQSSKDECSKGWCTGCGGHSYANKEYEWLFGSYLGGDGGVYVSTTFKMSREHVPKLPIEAVTNALSTRRIDHTKLRKHFLPLIDPQFTSQYGEGGFFRSLMIVAKAVDVYAGIPNAEVHFDVLHTTLYDLKWNIRDDDLDRKCLLAFAAFFSTGNPVVNPNDMTDVLAVSFNNSIYTLDALFHDPALPLEKYSLRHIIGNVGKPGLSFLIGTKTPEVQRPSRETWELVNHESFDGKFENNFGSTTMHLSLTGYEQPLDLDRNRKEHTIGRREPPTNFGSRDKEYFFVEAVISVHDHGIWVTDLDLFNTFEVLKTDPTILGMQSDDHLHTDTERDNFSAFRPVTSIDNWYEFLDPPKNAAVIRAQGSWMARLAMASIAVRLNRPLIITHGRFCWACAQEHFKSITLMGSRPGFPHNTWYPDPLFLC